MLSWTQLWWVRHCTDARGFLHVPMFSGKSCWRSFSRLSELFRFTDYWKVPRICRKNDETFEKCSTMLEQNKAIIIFSEGLCIQERQLRKLKKGSARIAFGSEEKNNFNLDLMIVPVGVNFSANPWKFRSGLYIEVW